MLYLASRYEERVVEVFESRVTRLNAWKSARVQRMHVRARMRAGGMRQARGRCAGTRQGTRARGVRAGGARELAAGARVRTVHPRVTIFTEMGKST
ncbi:hypothetical protein CDL15_Pgr021951 [Punica granatum]|uniref:Uncharacterized protein n=1 Tax=Punica granatum TaxID=22663 RepID=A0A218WCZ5_PUNGR|nr:hypothetical protein CDL15_Pgr021951 [Punica granatum]